jgi:hypothetical protein
MATQTNSNYTVSGYVTNPQGELLEGLKVCAYDQSSEDAGKSY